MLRFMESDTTEGLNGTESYMYSSNYMLSTRESFDIQRHKQVKSEKMGKDLTANSNPKLLGMQGMRLW